MNAIAKCFISPSAARAGRAEAFAGEMALAGLALPLHADDRFILDVESRVVMEVRITVGDNAPDLARTITGLINREAGMA